MTTIQWTDETWNPTSGCSRVSEGCRHCYIERTPPFRMAGRKLGDPVRLHAKRLYQPMEWRKPRRVFVNSLSDLFHDDIPEDFIKEVFTVMAISKRHTFQILTKRPNRMRDILSKWSAEDMYDYWHAFSGEAREVQGWPLPNVWLGVSVEDQKTADERVRKLAYTPAAVRFVSAEPLLGPVMLSNYGSGSSISWVIVGGESGPKARPCELAWIWSIVAQCKTAKVPCFVKQLGDYVLDRNDAGFDGEMPTDWPMDTDVDDPENEWNWQGAKIRVRLSKKGGNPEEWPADLRVREWPR